MERCKVCDELLSAKNVVAHMAEHDAVSPAPSATIEAVASEPLPIYTRLIPVFIDERLPIVTAVVYLDQDYKPFKMDLDATTITRLGLDHFSQALIEHPDKTPIELINAVKVNEFGRDLADALVNKPDPMRDAKYGPLWGTVPDGALKYEPQIAERQAQTWDWKNDKPGESLVGSLRVASGGAA